MSEIRPGDWVEIVCPEKPWFHGEIGEVLSVYPEDGLYSQRYVTVAFSRTPKFPNTHWIAFQLILLPRTQALTELGEDYFA